MWFMNTRKIDFFVNWKALQGCFAKKEEVQILFVQNALKLTCHESQCVMFFLLISDAMF